MTEDLNEDLIEATIRRVAEAKAARESGIAAMPEPEAPPPAHQPQPEPESQAAAASVSPAVDEDLIAATIRRVAEAKASQAPARVEPEPVADAADVDEPEPAPAPARLMPFRGIELAPRDRGSSDGWMDAVAALRRELDATRRELQELTARFDALARPVDGQLPATAPAATVDDGEWDEAPQLPRMIPGQPPRPAILRDPSPRTATAERLEPEPEETAIDTRPLPKLLPPLHAAPKRGLDLLPRTYRITVEDKRRGVDLVPLHRALLGMDGVRDMSLLSYSNGVAIVAVEMIDEMDPHALEGAVSRAMSRAAKVEVHNETTMVVKLAEE